MLRISSLTEDAQCPQVMPVTVILTVVLMVAFRWGLNCGQQQVYHTPGGYARTSVLQPLRISVTAQYLPFGQEVSITLFTSQVQPNPAGAV
ncbi:hypothetical protein MMUR_29270 [Mycolicibacterium murale]|uniref:Uncharacterized protein n=1 Tax=Mycolicibacterium murale TaxID=182220 RepID=A0A7I9WM34_9MYCO|nr:hypothetical protein MMUR_29270 [Mycolicibacterium murale]